MDDESASSGSVLGLAGLASLCCLGPGTAAVASGAAASGLGGDLVEIAVTALVLGAVAVVIRRRTRCACET
jgi:hypothetical protein